MSGLGMCCWSEPIKAVGSYEVTMGLGAEVEPVIRVEVVEAEPAKPTTKRKARGSKVREVVAEAEAVVEEAAATEAVEETAVVDEVEEAPGFGGGRRGSCSRINKKHPLR